MQRISSKNMDIKQMNKLKAEIKHIQKTDCIHLTTLDFKGSKIYMLSLELNKDLKIGDKVTLSTKATHITLAKEFINNISCSNQFLVKVKKIKKGELVSLVKVDFKESILEAVIISKSLEEMNIKENDEVIMLVNPSEISILGTLDD